MKYKRIKYYRLLGDALSVHPILGGTLFSLAADELFFEFEKVVAVGRDKGIEKSTNAAFEPMGLARIYAVEVAAAEKAKFPYSKRTPT